MGSFLSSTLTSSSTSSFMNESFQYAFMNGMLLMMESETFTEDIKQNANIFTEAFTKTCKMLLLRDDENIVLSDNNDDDNDNDKTSLTEFMDVFRENVYELMKVEDPIEIELERLRVLERRYNQLVRDMDSYAPNGEGYGQTMDHYKSL